MAFKHCVIWALPRTGSTTLGRALHALNEPLQRGGGNFSGTSEIESLCASRKSIKHLYDECPNTSNLALARAADREGYRHLHLVRHSEFARLMSQGIAAQLDAWTPDIAAGRFTELREGKRMLIPFDVPYLLQISRAARDKWREIQACVEAPVLWISFEEIMAPHDATSRYASLYRLARYLGGVQKDLDDLVRVMATGGQDTESIWDFVPNSNELRQAVAAE